MTIHRLMYWLFLAVGMILFATVGFLLADPFLKAVDGWFEGPAPISPLWTRIGLTTAGLLMGILVANYSFQLLARVARHLEEAEPDEKLAIGLGLVSAAVITFALYPLLFAIGGARLGWALTLLAFVILVYLSVVSFLSMKEYLPLTAQMARRSRGIKVLDSSVIIDGRIRDIIRTGFLEGRIYVPGFVLDEVQHIADSEDPLRRARGRRGLDVLKQLQADLGENMEVRTHDRLAPHTGDEVDCAAGAPRQSHARRHRDQRLQPEPRRGSAGRARAEHQRTRRSRAHPCAAGRRPDGHPHPRGAGTRSGHCLPRRRHDGRGGGRARVPQSGD
jgi:uncharacterized protein YacL